MLSAKEDMTEDGIINKNGRLYNVQTDDDENETSNAGSTQKGGAPYAYRAVYLLLSLCYLRWTI